MRTLTPQDLKSMLDRMEEMANGNRDEAQRMLNELENLLDNLKMARPASAASRIRRGARWSSRSTSSTR